jgi:hypothetical protein
MPTSVNSRSRDDLNEYMKQRRAMLKEKGICVDCQQSPAQKPHVCCQCCLDQRRDRENIRRRSPSLPFRCALQL